MRRSLTALLVGALVLSVGLVPAGAAGTGTAEDETSRPRPEPLKLACIAIEKDDRPAVACDWAWAAPAPSLTAANSTTDPVEPIHYRLWRGGDGHRRVVYRGTQTRALDEKVRRGQTYLYLVQALDLDGDVIGRSEVVKVQIPRHKPDHLDLACAVLDAAAHPGVAVACKWSDAGAPDLAGYRLWRGSKGERRLVYRGAETSAVDTKVRSGHRYGYIVVAVGPRGRVLAVSDLVKVAVPPRPEPKPIPLPEPKPEPLPFPKPLPEPRPVPKPIPFPEPKPDPLPVPDPWPGPDSKPLPEPRPAPEPKPVPDPRPIPEPQPVEPMKLACRVLEEAARPTPAVACRWSASSRADVAGYLLWRVERNAEKKIVFKSRSETGFVDTQVLAGHSYAYLVQAIDAHGRVIGASEAVRVDVPGVPPDPGTDPAKPTEPVAVTSR